MKKISLPKQPKYKKGNQFEAEFEVKDCHPGYGNTLGNALRRVILSSLAGFAVTKVKIKNVDHEFTTIPGVKENIVQIILNLKKLRFKMHQEEPLKVTLKVNGEKEVRASDIKLPSNIETVNPEALIGTINEPNGSLEMEMTVEKGIGYSPVESREDDNKEVGSIAIDALFTPIRKINYSVENMRVGKRTDYDKITFNIETDGSILPEEAFREAAKILVKQFALLAEAKEEDLVMEVKEELTEKEDFKGMHIDDISEAVRARSEKDDLSIEELNLSKRISGILKENELDTIGKVSKKTEEELSSLEGMGEKAIKEIKKSIGAHGIILKEE